MMMSARRSFPLFTLFVLLPAFLAAQEAEKRISFTRDVRPILSDRCFACHGPDENKHPESGLRFDKQSGGAFEALKDGAVPIVPGKPEESELIRRLVTDDPNLKMPPPDANLEIAPEETELLRQWIRQGAEWEGHWSFNPVERPEPPEVENEEWVRSPVDRFILERLEREDVEPSDEADKRTLIRRLSLDLTGIPPTLEEIHGFLRDDSPEAYENLVDRLLASPRYGEHMATDWLDAARYADTSGFHHDDTRFMWRWRDWVIDAYNENLPYDKFVTWQMAGDLIPDATMEQKMATGFHRNHGITAEGGAIDEEYRVHYVSDRVATTGTVFLGLTLDCARCHSHKYDPITHKDYYKFFAFFNGVPERGLGQRKGNNAPVLKTPSEEQERRMEELTARMDGIKEYLRAPIPELDARQREWEGAWLEKLSNLWTVAEPKSAESVNGASLKVQGDGSILAEGENPEKDVHIVTFTVPSGKDVTGIRLEGLLDEHLPRKGPGRAGNGNVVLTGVSVLASPVEGDGEPVPVSIAAAQADFSQTDGDFHIFNALDEDLLSGWAVGAHQERSNREAVFLPGQPFGFDGGTQVTVKLKYESPHKQHVFGRFRLSYTAAEEALADTPAEYGPWSEVSFSTQNKENPHDRVFPPEEEPGEIDLAAQYGEGKSWALRPGYADRRVNTLQGEYTATYLYRQIHAPTERNTKLWFGSDDALKVWLNGEKIVASAEPRGIAEDQNSATVTLRRGVNHLLMKVSNYETGYGFFFRAEDATTGSRNLSLSATASSPDGIEKDGGATGDAAAIDGDPETFWDEVDDKDLYVLQLDWTEPQTVASLKITGYEHHSYAPKNFDIVCDGEVVRRVRNATYTDNQATFTVPPTECETLQLRISGYYGRSPAIRELEVYPSEKLPDHLTDILRTAPENRSEDQRVALMDAFRMRNWAEAVPKYDELAELEAQRKAVEESVVTTMVMEDMQPMRDTFVLVRGSYDQHGEQVSPGVPSALPPMPEDAPMNRLGLAEWMTMRENPLVSRVAVNRYWKKFFGTGLVKTLGDFGSQGEWPSHPALLDWLAAEYMESGWDTKALLKTIVTSSTYRQSSAIRYDLQQRDPENRLLARSSRFRLPAEAVRDNALAISGLLVEKVGGPSVKPYHPLGLWAEVSFGGSETYKVDEGDDIYRRGLYTFWKRTVPPVSLYTFDAPDREYCVVNRPVTSTPLQALVLLNDPTYIEAARALAARTLETDGPNAAGLATAFERATARPPKPHELETLTEYLAAERQRFEAQPEDIEKVLSIGRSGYSDDLNTVNFAAMTMVCSAILNLDETITRE